MSEYRWRQRGAEFELVLDEGSGAVIYGRVWAELIEDFATVWRWTTKFAGMGTEDTRAKACEAAWQWVKSDTEGSFSNDV